MITIKEPVFSEEMKAFCCLVSIPELEKQEKEIPIYADTSNEARMNGIEFVKSYYKNLYSI
jgi:hypothetical protein